MSGLWKPAMNSTRQSITWIFCAPGDSHERAAVIQQQMADSKLDELRQRLEEIHKEETEDGYDIADVA